MAKNNKSKPPAAIVIFGGTGDLTNECRRDDDTANAPQFGIIQDQEFGPQAGIGEENRQEERGDEVLHTTGNGVPQSRLIREHRPQQERSEDRKDADEVRRQCCQ